MSAKSPSRDLTRGLMAPLLFRMTVPMLYGMMGIVVFNLSDTWFVGQLGTQELAALGFTFPVVLLIGSLSLGIGFGGSALISHAIGQGDRRKVQRLTTDMLSLALLIVACISVLGVLTIDPLFRALGASAAMLPLIHAYMDIWYLGSVALVIPMVGNSAIRATGDTKTPSNIMLIAMGINLLMDPLLIFGLGPFPKMGLAGAALATVISRMVTLIVALWILLRREKMITFKIPALQVALRSWQSIMYLGIPAAATAIVTPVAAGIVTRLVAAYGEEAVAGLGVATRIESFALMITWALNSVLGPVIGQNLGAGRLDRIRQALRVTFRFDLLWGLATLLLLAPLGSFLGGLFNDDPQVIQTVSLYLWIVPLAYGAQSVAKSASTALNVLRKPVQSTAIMVFQSFVLYLPLAWLLQHRFDISGIFWANTVSNLIAAIVGWWLLTRTLRKLSEG